MAQRARVSQLANDENTIFSGKRSPSRCDARAVYRHNPRSQRLFWVPLLLIAVAVLVSLFALSHANSGNSYQQVASSEIVCLINQGQVNSALISDTSQTIQVTTKSGKQLEASWGSRQGSQLQNALQAQLGKGNLPGGYNVTISKSNALLDVVASALIILVIVLLLFWGVDYPTQFKRWRALADRAGQMAKRRVQPT